MKPVRVLSIDPGLRNLAVADVSLKAGWTWPEPCTRLAYPKEPIADFHTRCLSEFLASGWVLNHLEVIDVSKSLDRVVTDIKRMPLTDKVDALHNSYTRLKGDWFAGGTEPLDVVVAEIQHNTNAEMKAVCEASLMFFACEMPDAKRTAITGVHKLKICDMLGIPEGAGLAFAEASKRPRKRKRPAAGVEPEDDPEPEPEDDVDGDGDEDAEDEDEDEDSRKKKGFRKVGEKWIRTKKGAVDKYKDNKLRSICALEKLKPQLSAFITTATAKIKKRDDVADALLQGLWALWLEIRPAKKPKVIKDTKALPFPAPVPIPVPAPPLAPVPKPKLKRKPKPDPESDPPGPPKRKRKAAKEDEGKAGADTDDDGLPKPTLKRKLKADAEPPKPKPKSRRKAVPKTCFVDLTGDVFHE